MNIILGQEQAQALSDKYTVLRLDRVCVPGHDGPINSYCVVDNIPLHEMVQLDMWRDLHENLIENYTQRNWNYCEQAIEHLRGKWNGQLDSFYDILQQRVSDHKKNDPGPDWTDVITVQR